MHKLHLGGCQTRKASVNLWEKENDVLVQGLSRFANTRASSLLLKRRMRNLHNPFLRSSRDRVVFSVKGPGLFVMTAHAEDLELTNLLLALLLAEPQDSYWSAAGSFLNLSPLPPSE